MSRNDSLEMGELTDTMYYILLSLLEPKHGYLIMKFIESITNHQVIIGPASLYTSLKKLLKAELIELQNDEGDRKTYVATAKGIKLLKSEVERRKTMVMHAEEIFNKKGDF